MSSLRITAGTLRGRRITVPRGDVRPTSERARQAYFNIIGDRIDGAHFLDLFSGSGIFAFEALSRGAASATTVDRDKLDLGGITKQALAMGVQVTTLAGEMLTVLRRLKERFDLVYADPPYDYHEYKELVSGIGGLSLADDAIVAVEHRRNTSPFDARTGKLEIWRRAEYSEVWITFLRAHQPAATPLAMGPQ